MGFEPDDFSMTAPTVIANIASPIEVEPKRQCPIWAVWAYFGGLVCSGISRNSLGVYTNEGQ